MTTVKTLRASARIASACLGLTFALALLLAPSAQASFGIAPGSFTTTALNRDGTTDTQAGSHPFSYTVSFALNQNGSGKPEGNLRDAIATLPPGLIGDPLAIPDCPSENFYALLKAICPNATQLGVLHATIAGIGQAVGPVSNLPPSLGEPAHLGFSAGGFNALQDASLRADDGYRVAVATNNAPVAGFIAASETIWGVPPDPGHDFERGWDCLEAHSPCPVSSEVVPRPFLTLPTSCGAPLETSLEVDSEEEPGVFAAPGHTETALSRDAGGTPTGLTGCGAVPFSPKLLAAPTTNLAENPSGLGFELRLPDFGLEQPEAIAESQPKRAEVILPEGMTINPSAAEGIGVCTEAQLEAETLEAAPGAGCPAASKVASVEIHSPLIEEAVEGAVYLAAPHENQFHSLLALYIVARAPERGVLVKLAGKVEPNPETGQLVATFENLPPVPFSSFKLHFAEGPRAQLVTPPACGTYRIEAKFTPFSSSEPTTTSSAFQVEHGADGGPCPSGGVPPFKPGLLAGTQSNSAGRYSPFYLRLTRKDSEQEFTHFSIKLPPGLTGRLAGIPFCPEAAIAKARSREHEGGGAEELAAPSCPAASEVGHTLVGAGVGGALTYVPGKVYLAGSYHGSALSIVAVTAAVAGPFDLGTVVVRQTLKINPETAEVFIDAAGSDPIPHIIQGIPVHARDIRVYVDKHEFVLNPTGCARTSTASTVLGSGLDFASEADDQPFTVTSPFQAADCASLGFKPKLALSLKGGTRRAGNPALKAVVTYPKGGYYANIASAQVTLPHSEFLDNAHIKTICTRVVFAQGTVPGEKCPADSIYGFAKAVTPLLSEPLQGPVFLRSSSHQLPDLVAALHNGEINIDLDGHVEGVKGGIRNTFEAVPDAPVTKFTLEMQGGSKGLLENSTNLCLHPHHATAVFTGHNGKVDAYKPLLQVKCGKNGKGKKHRSARK